MKKKLVCCEVMSAICTLFLTLIGIGTWPCKQLGILKSNNDKITIGGTIFIIILAIISIILTFIVIFEEMNNICTDLKKKACKNIYSEEKMREKYRKLLKNCQEAIILVRHLDHLCKDEVQKKRIEVLGSKCTILYELAENSCFEEQLKDKHVKLIKFPLNNDVSNIKGQIVKGPNRKSLFIEKKEDEEFHLLNIENEYIQAVILKDIDDLIKNLQGNSQKL